MRSEGARKRQPKKSHKRLDAGLRAAEDQRASGKRDRCRVGALPLSRPRRFFCFLRP
jgi:hypothetical protein